MSDVSLETEGKVAALNILDKADDMVGTDIVAPVQAEVEKIEDAVEAKVEAAVAVVEKIIQEVETGAKEGLVAGENLVRKVLHINLNAGGGSVIKNPG